MYYNRSFSRCGYPGRPAALGLYGEYKGVGVVGCHRDVLTYSGS